MITKPMLAATLTDLNNLDFQHCRYLATPKIDGIRALKVNRNVVSRTFKPIRNTRIRMFLEQFLPEGADGEIIVGDGKSFQKTSSGVMSEKGDPDFTYYIFDLVSDINQPYYERIDALQKWYKSLLNQKDWSNEISTQIALGLMTHVKIIPLIPVEIKSEEALKEYEEKCITDGFEGVILRTYDSPYKCGRSTEKQQWLLKIKRFADDEAIVLGFGERMHNENKAKKDAFGHTIRSSAKDGLIPAGTLGYLSVKDLKTDIEFEIGSGFDDAMRQEIWDNRTKYQGMIVKYKHFAITGVKEKPRFPVFLGFRDSEDM